MRSNLHSPVLIEITMTAVDSLLSVGCITIHSIPSTLQSVFKNVSLLGSCCTSIGNDVIYTFTSSKNLIRSGLHDATHGMSDLKYFLMRSRRDLIRISKYGT